MKRKITPFLWFDTQGEEAVDFYVSVFKDAEKQSVRRCGKSFPGREEQALTVSFTLFGQEFVALNGGPAYSFTPAVSFLVECETQDEVDDLWAKLTADGGKPMQCGWLADKYGISWQIIPRAMSEMLADPDQSRAERVMQAMMRMVKIDIAALERARDGEG
jgi:predicted 3-demethylubiquinone-9 3-methyltransferase (glyoxalase superfamily)